MAKQSFDKVKVFINKKLSAYNIQFIEDYRMLTFDFEGSLEELSDKLSPEINLTEQDSAFASFSRKRSSSLEWESEKYGVSAMYIEPNKVMVIVTIW
ncbi:hypothetical protein [Providencia sp. Me31A]|uniref:hypothetical protein n=1 Tax=Providencia sp. Me31A TaxID=3392637 RepID=UPI003D2B7C97